MKYYLIAGEASGDLHGAALVKSLKRRNPQAICRAWGGSLMKAAGAEVVKDYSELAFMGFMEVLKNINTIRKNFTFCKEELLQYQPDVLILIDYPGFNLRMAKWAHQKGIRVFYYISPQLWAWNTRRVHQIKKNVERMFVILPFEKAFYQKYDYEVDYVGHPLMDVIPTFQSKMDIRDEYQLDKRPIVALLPGSRKQEVRKMLPTMLSIAHEYTFYQFIICGVSSLAPEVYEECMQGIEPKDIFLIFDQTYEILNITEAALVTSGTATLEAALFEVPQIVCYQGNHLSYLLAKQLIKVDSIALVNLIAEKKIVRELIQEEYNPKQLSEELGKILHSEKRQEILEDYKVLKEKLGYRGASEKCANLIEKYLAL